MAVKYWKKMLEESQKLLGEELISYNIPDNGEITHADLLMLTAKCKEFKLST